MNINRETAYGSNIVIIGTEHNTFTGTKEKDIYNQLSNINPDIVCLEFPENGHPNQDIDDIKYGDVSGALSICRENNIRYEPVDKYIEGHEDVLRKEISDAEKEKLANAKTGGEAREIIFECAPNFSSQIHKREQNILNNILKYAGEYNTICIVIGSSHIQPIINGLDIFSY